MADKLEEEQKEGGAGVYYWQTIREGRGRGTGRVLVIGIFVFLLILVLGKTNTYCIWAGDTQQRSGHPPTV